MDESVEVIELLSELIDSRVQFFGRGLNGMPHLNRAASLGAFLATENRYIDLIDRIYRNQTRSNLVANLITWGETPILVHNNTMEPVRITPSAEQIAVAIRNIPSSETNCAICQEAIQTDATRIIHCGHDYHHACLNNWFTMSVRCPVCRFDIRDTNPNVTDHSTQTSFASR